MLNYCSLHTTGNNYQNYQKQLLHTALPRLHSLSLVTEAILGAARICGNSHTFQKENLGIFEGKFCNHLMEDRSKSRRTDKSRVYSGSSSVNTRAPHPSEQKRKKKGRAPRNEYVLAINMAAKCCDRNAAMAAFRGAREAGIQLQQETMNSLLYILVGGDQWGELARMACEKSLEEHSAIQDSEPTIVASSVSNVNEDRKIIKLENGPQKDDDFRDEVFAYMEEGQMFSGEMAYTAQARLAACHADGGQAFDFLEKMIVAKIPAKLRMFTPSLVCFATLGQVEGAFKIEEMIRTQGLDLSEYEFRLILEACSKSGTYNQLSRLLTTIGEERTHLEDSTVKHIENFFGSERSKDVFKEDGPLNGKQMWMQRYIEVESDGYSDFAGGKVAPIDLEAADWDKFLQGVREMAVGKERNTLFDDYLKWIDEHGPYDIIVDGANVAMHGQNFQGSFFRFQQINSIMELLEREFPERRALVIIHIGRLHSAPARDPRAKNLIADLQTKNQLYATPVGSNDDWYWLHAAIRAKQSSLVVSNDECRDHLFQLLTPKYFLKWKERHMVRFSFQKSHRGGLQATIKLPAAYTPCIQEIYSGTWMVPCIGGKWLCVKAV